MESRAGARREADAEGTHNPIYGAIPWAHILAALSFAGYAGASLILEFGRDTRQLMMVFAIIPIIVAAFEGMRAGLLWTALLFTTNFAIHLGSDGFLAGLPTMLLGHGLTAGCAAIVGRLVELSRRLREESKARLELVERVAQREARLIEAKKAETVGRLVGGVAHDFNNMLMVIRMNTRLVREEPASPDATELMAAIERAADRGSALVRKLLAVGRRQPLQPVLTTANELVRGSEDFLRSVLGRECQLALELVDRDIWLNVDVSALEQVLLNLASNARDAMPAGGTVTISTAHLPPGVSPSHSALVAAKQGIATITVRDSGAGMDSGILASAFDPFYSTKPSDRGSGLGLASVRGAIEQSGGHVSVESEVGQGTQVCIELPCVAAEHCEPSPRSARSKRVQAKTGPTQRPEGADHILVVDDQPEVARVSRRLLERAGFFVTVFHSGSATLAYARDRDLDHVDAVITDITMPGMDGFELAGELQTLRPELPVLYISGYADEFLASDSGIPPGALLSKPVDPEELIRRVAATIAAARSDGHSDEERVSA